MRNGTLTGTGFLSDPFFTFGANSTNTKVLFQGTPLADTSNPGRYTMFSTNPTSNPFNISILGIVTPFDVVVYQTSGDQLFWMNEDQISVFVGSLQTQGWTAGFLAARQPSAKNATLKKQ
jgi:hypothetical protein